MNETTKHLKQAWNGDERYPFRERAYCNDGYSISIQVGQHTYCYPRQNNAIHYTEVELGFPSQYDPLIDDYAEEPNTLQTVFPYTSITLVDQLINKHGGLRQMYPLNHEVIELLTIIRSM